jgi:GNAT superfamily N-acetyltransferase
MLIRPARASDADAIGALWLKLVMHHRQLDPNMPKPTPDGAYHYARRIRDQIDDPYTKVFVAVDEESDAVVGYVMGIIIDLLPEMFQEERGGFLADIFVEHSQRGRGTGKSLVKALRNWFAGRGVERYEWYVAAANLQAQGFWRAMGGREVMIRMRAEIDIDIDGDSDPYDRDSSQFDREDG